MSEHHTNNNIIVRSYLVPYWSGILLTIAVLVAVVYVVLLFGLEHMSPNGQLLSAFYWFYVDGTPANFAHLICEAILGAALVALVVWFVANLRRSIKSLRGWGLLFVGAVSFCVLAFFALMFLVSPNNKHLDEQQQDSKIYRLASWQTSSDDYSNILFECDSLGIMCSEICASKVDYAKILTQQPEIAVSSSPQTISVVDNEQTLCSTKAQS